MSFLYPRSITITRQKQSTTFGSQPYSGLSPDNESVIASNLAAHIQIDRGSPSPGAKLPGDALAQSVWKIIFRGPRGLARTDDIITDDLGNRYQVISADWGPMVTTCRSQILQN